MGQRREARTEAKLPVRIFGTDAEGRVFSENVTTLDISHTGAKLTGVRASIKPGEIVGITYGKNKSRFSVQWVGLPGTPLAGQIGVLNVSPEKYIWDTDLPSAGFDSYRPVSGSDRRRHDRMKCVNSVQLHPHGQAAPIWGKAVDLSTGGCFVEMSIPLELGAKLRIGLWLNENKLQLHGKVVNTRPGFGIGIQFTEVAPDDADQLKKFLKSITQINK
jgi:c-di-GMP-binding flagellar brake protein YcgR